MATSGRSLYWAAGRALVPLLLASAFLPAPASADPEDGDVFYGFSEIRIGALAHQVEDSPGEEGVDLNLEVLFDKLPGDYGNRIIQHFLTPRPHIGTSINLNGDTSQLYFGFTWDLRLTERIFFESSFGGAAHNGPHDGEEGESAFGCGLNFRESASLGYDISDRWNVLVTVDHMSNAGLCDENRGLTNAGVRLGYKW